MATWVAAPIATGAQITAPGITTLLPNTAPIYNSAPLFVGAPAATSLINTTSATSI